MTDSCLLLSLTGRRVQQFGKLQQQQQHSADGTYVASHPGFIDTAPVRAATQSQSARAAVHAHGSKDLAVLISVLLGCDSSSRSKQSLLLSCLCVVVFAAACSPP